MTPPKIDHKKMVEDINELVNNDFCCEMNCHQLPNHKPFTQDEAMTMAGILGSVYMIAHAVDGCCAGKYRVVTKQKKAGI